MYLYYEARPVLHGLRSDWFGVVGVPGLCGGATSGRVTRCERRGVGPLVVVEALSRETKEGDVGRGAPPPVGAPRKWDVYERRLRVPYYVTVDHHRRPAAVTFYRHDGEGFRAVVGAERGLWLAGAGWGLGCGRGTHAGLRRAWVRFDDATGAWIRTGEERVRQERRGRLEERRARLAVAEAGAAGTAGEGAVGGQTPRTLVGPGRPVSRFHPAVRFRVPRPHFRPQCANRLTRLHRRLGSRSATIEPVKR